MIIKGPVFNKLRKHSLDFYPKECKYNVSDRETFRSWLLKGMYTPISSSKTELIFDADHTDMGSFFLRDIEFISNHCFEHLQECLCYTSDNRMRSDAWSIVTIYYFGFFCIQGLLRLIGKPIMFIPIDVINQLKKIFSPTNFPGSGTFILEKVQDVGATQSRYKLKKHHKRFHEASWSILLMTLDRFKNEVSTISSSSKATKEILFFDLITNKKPFRVYSDYQWPSSVRNRANYEPGFAYLLVEKKFEGKTKSLLKNWIDYHQDNLNKLLKSSTTYKAKKGNEFSQQAKLLHDFTIAHFILFRELYSDLMKRRRYDKRMELKRKVFIEKMTILSSHNYPFISSF